MKELKRIPLFNSQVEMEIIYRTKDGFFHSFRPCKTSSLNSLQIFINQTNSNRIRQRNEKKSK